MSPKARRTVVAVALSAVVVAALILARQEAGPAGRGAETDGKPSFIVFTVDMLRADHLGIHGYPKRTSPVLDALAGEGVVFDNALSPSSWTLPSVISVLTGLPPSAHGATTVAGEHWVAQPGTWLPQLFARAGYRTAAFHTHPYLRRDVSNFAEAFTEVVDPTEARSGDDPGIGGFSAAMYLDTLYPAVASWLERHGGEPFFLYVHVIDVHGPWNTARFLREDRRAVEAGLASGEIELPRLENGWYAASTKGPGNPHKHYLYDGHIGFVDYHLGLLYRKLRDLGVADHTYLVYTSDHGEGFGEHHDWWAHGAYAYQEQIHVPLVFLSHAELRDGPRRVSEVVNTTGLVPTLLDLAGLEHRVAAGTAPGFSELLDGAPPPGDLRQPSLSEAARYYYDLADEDAFTLDGRHKLITDTRTGQQRLYDLRADPGERAPLATSGQVPPAHAEVFRELSEGRARYLAAQGPADAVRRELDAADRQRLQALGYVL